MGEPCRWRSVKVPALSVGTNPADGLRVDFPPVPDDAVTCEARWCWERASVASPDVTDPAMWELTYEIRDPEGNLRCGLEDCPNCSTQPGGADEVDDNAGAERGSGPTEVARPAPASAEPMCIRCGCTDSQACDGGCWWLTVDRAAGIGVCSSCAECAEEARYAMAEAT